MTTREVRAAYSALAALYIERIGTLHVVHRDDRALIAGHLGQLAGRIIDLGCGPGHLTAFLHAQGRDVAGVDPVPEFIEHARATHPGVEFEVGSLEDLVRSGTVVQGVLAWYSLIHVQPSAIQEALGAVRGIVEPGGIVVLGFFTGPDGEAFEHKVVTAYRWSLDGLSARCADVGFGEVERLERGQDGERRPHGVLVLRAD